MLTRMTCGLKSLAELTLRQGRRLVAIVFGVTLLLIGVALLFAPGPGMLIIYAGIAVLATELVWARRLLSQIKKRACELGEALNNQGKFSRRRRETASTPHSTPSGAPSAEPTDDLGR